MPAVVNQTLTSTFTGTGQNATPKQFEDVFNVSVSGTFVATVILEASRDDGATYVPVLTVTGPIDMIQMYQPQRGWIYRWRCSEYTSGTATCLACR